MGGLRAIRTFGLAAGAAWVTVGGTVHAFFPPLPVTPDPITVLPPPVLPQLPPAPPPVVPPVVPPVPPPPFVPPEQPERPQERPPCECVCPEAPQATPEPATLVMAAVGLAAAGVARRRRSA